MHEGQEGQMAGRAEGQAGRQTDRKSGRDTGRQGVTQVGQCKASMPGGPDRCVLENSISANCQPGGGGGRGWG